MQFYTLILGILGVWRVTHLLNAEDGPSDIFVRMRRQLGSGFWGSLVDCFYCLSLWVAAPFAIILGATWRERMLLWLALSGAACLLERATSARGGPQWFYREGEGAEHELLRQKEGDSGSSIEPKA
jgi:uncharacterized protein DUF1360